MQNAKCKVQSAKPSVKARCAILFSFGGLQFFYVFILVCLCPRIATAEDAPPKLVGSASCATAACHGGLAGHKFVGAEFRIWSARDPHARAYSVLLNDLSRQMVEQLQLPKPAHESAVCLNCHSPASSTESKRTTISGRVPFDGVGCEQCHGPAEHWLTPHVRRDWKQRSMDEKRRLGYRDLTDILTRANVCADCHVGGSDRDVNHDLMAAGHPRLFFELSTFHANWPKHWPDDVDAKRYPAPHPTQSVPGASESGSLFESKLWVVGQVVTAQRSLELLNQRATSAQNHPAKWPEFAEWNCFACHHDLQSASWWQSRDESQRPRVSFAANAWPYALLEPLARELHGPDLSNPDSSLVKLRTHFTKPWPPTDTVSLEASSVAASLRAWAEQLNRDDPVSPEALRLKLIERDGPRLIATDWDSATQLFLSLNALQHAAVAARKTSTPADLERDGMIQINLDSMNATLNFQPGLRSPRDFAAQPILRLQSDLRRLRTILSTPSP